MRLGTPRAMFVAAALLAGGCLEIETRVKIAEDGSASLTERVLFTARLLDLAGAQRPALAQRLSREAALERMQEMGSGLSLVRHEVRELDDGSMESRAEIAVPDLNGFRYLSPWPAHADWASNNAIRVEFGPRYKSAPYGGGNAGCMSVSFRYDKPPRGQPGPPKDGPPPRGPAPAEQQVYREIAPVVRDLVKGLRLRFTCESYAPVHSGLGVRGAGSTAIDVIDISDENMDQAAAPFWANEEVMLEVARGDFWGPNIARNVRGYDSNFTLPLFTPLGSPHMWWLGSQNIWFPPSRQLFDKHFAGKKLDFSPWAASPPEKQVPARWQDVGWQGWKDRPAETGAAPGGGTP